MAELMLYGVGPVLLGPEVSARSEVVSFIMCSSPTLVASIHLATWDIS
jgi:hypothetical protein